MLTQNNTDIIATIVVIVAAVIIMSFVVLGLALAAYTHSKKGQAAKQAVSQKTPAKAKQKKQAAAASNDTQSGNTGIMPQLGYQQPLLLSGCSNLLLPAASVPLMLEGGRQLAIAEHAETAEEQAPEDTGLTLKESIAIAMAAAVKHININKRTVAAWLTENYGEEIKLNRRNNRTSTGLPLADTHYLIKKGKQKCFIYVYDFDEERSMLLLRADDKTATEIIEQYPSIRKSLFPKSNAEQWYTLIPNIGFETEEQIYNIIAFIIARLMFGEDAPVVFEPVPVEEPAAPATVIEEVAEEPAIDEGDGLTLKESIALAAATISKHININKTTVAKWLTENYGDAILLNRRDNRTKTGLPLADTHYINRNGDKKCFIYVYELSKEKSMLLLRADKRTAAEITGQYPSIKRSLFPKTTQEGWYTLVPNLGFESEEEIYDIIALIIERLVFGNKSRSVEYLPLVEEGPEPAVAEEEVVVEEPVEQPAEVAEEEVAETAEEPIELEDEEEDIEEEDEELPPEQVDVEVAARGITLKESIALANAMAQMKINKSTVAAWLTKKYGDSVILNRRENRIKTGLPLPDTHYVMRNGKKKCFIYVYELSDDKSFLLLKTDGITASEIAEKNPLFLKSRFPKSKYEQWYTLVPDICYKNAKEVFDVIELVLSRFLEHDETKVLYEKVYAKRNGHRKPGKKFAVNCDTLAKNYKAGETVNMENLKEKGIVPKSAKQIKILARGALTKPLTVIADDFSAEAVMYISKIGGNPILTD
ncbi:MAG: uL15 family ribosomal protein [Clostridia bacterium]|nr:uL15 family ribosomal protein [Clostridia bacterium]